MRPFRTFAKYVLLLELALVVVLVVGLVIPLPGRIEFKIVQSGSMEPEIPVGAVVVIVPRAEYGIGDVITFGDDTRTRIPTTHRIVGVERVGGVTHYRTKGDANQEPDGEPVPHGAVIGAIELTVPRLGYVLHFARTEYGFFLTVVIPAAIIILDEFINIAVMVRRRYGYGMGVDGEHRSTVPPHAVRNVSIDGIDHVSQRPTVELRRRSTGRGPYAHVDGLRIVLRSL